MLIIKKNTEKIHIVLSLLLILYVLKCSKMLNFSQHKSEYISANYITKCVTIMRYYHYMLRISSSESLGRFFLFALLIDKKVANHCALSETVKMKVQFAIFVFAYYYVKLGALCSDIRSSC